MEPILFGKYLLSEKIAEGGMAVVYRAQLTGPGGFVKTLVVKQIRAELSARPEFVELFVKEAKTTVQLTHANIVPVFELGMVDGTYFLALELVDGPPLATLVEKGPFPAPLAGYVIEQILRGLDYAHRRDIVHRDLSPANVLCSRDGEVRLLDFGISAEVSGRAVVGGSHGYMAPEQEAGGRVDARSDLYSVGVLLWELLAGRRRDPGLPAGIPDALRAVLERALAPQPEDRWPSAEAMLTPITRYLRDTESSTQAELARLVRLRAPDTAVSRRPAADEIGEDDKPSGPRTTPLASRTPHTTPHAVTFATRFIEAEPEIPLADEPVEPLAGESRPASIESPLPLRAPALSRLGIGAGALALVVASAFAGARLRDAIATAPPPVVPLAPASALLAITVDPPQAALTVDGVAATPDAHGIVPVIAGTHAITATIADRPTAELSLTVVPGERRAVKLVVPAALGKLTVRTDPPDGDVRIGDRSVGTAPITVEVRLDAALRVRADKHDYATAERVVQPSELRGGPPRAATVTLKLEARAKGQLTLGARPWAHVTIDGEHRSDTPLVRVPLVAGPHTVKLACPATGKELRFTVQIEPDRELKRVADLTASEPHLLESQP